MIRGLLERGQGAFIYRAPHDERGRLRLYVPRHGIGGALLPALVAIAHERKRCMAPMMNEPQGAGNAATRIGVSFRIASGDVRSMEESA